jgi:hypothetical protein
MTTHSSLHYFVSPHAKRSIAAFVVVSIALEVARSLYIASAEVAASYRIIHWRHETKNKRHARRLVLRDYTYRLAAGSECASHGIVLVHFSPRLRQFSHGFFSSHLILLSRHESQARTTFLLFPLAVLGGVVDVVGGTGLI